MLLSRVTSSGHLKLSQDQIKLSNPTVSRAGLLSGTTIETRKRRCPMPSSTAASNRSFGICMKNWRSRKIQKTLTSEGTISAKYVLYQPRLNIMTSFGHQRQSSGTIIVTSTSTNSSFLPGSSIRASA